jgi:hypothetical protein
MSRQGPSSTLSLDALRQDLPPSTSAASPPLGSTAPCNVTDILLTTVYVLLTNTYLIFILLGSRARRARKTGVFFEVLCEVMGRSIGPATISSPFCGAGALRVVYAPNPWICLILFVRIGTFQGVMANPNKKKRVPVSGCMQKWLKRASSLIFFLRQAVSRGAGSIRRTEDNSTRSIFQQAISCRFRGSLRMFWTIGHQRGLRRDRSRPPRRDHR